MAFLFLDLEFNQGRNSNYFEIIQIGMVKTDMFWEEKKLINRFVKPTLATCVNKDVQRITGISIRDLRYRGISLDSIIDEIKRSISIGDVSHIITWGNTDVKILKSNCVKNGIDYSFLDGIEVVDLQKLYMCLNGLKQYPSLHKITANMSYCKEHDGLHDVYRLIQLSKEIGIKNIVNSKSLLRNYSTKTLFKTAKKLLKNRQECLCGDDKLTIFLEGEIIKVNTNEYERLYLLKCNSCNCKYKAIAKSRTGIKPASWIEDISIVNNIDYFNEVNKIITQAGAKNPLL